MIQIDLYNLTDEHLELAARTRRAHPETVANIETNRRWDAARRRAEAKAEAARIASLRSCRRCGIDTSDPDVCIDCRDVLALEAP
jgi:hypothetical protein